MAAWDGQGWRLPAVAPPVPAESRLLQLLLGGGFLYVLASGGQARTQTLTLTLTPTLTFTVMCSPEQEPTSAG